MACREADEGEGDCDTDEELERDVHALRELLEMDGTTEETEVTENQTLQQLQHCLQKNQELQGYLLNCLKEIDQALKETRLNRERLKVFGRECCKQACTLWKFRRRKSYFHDYLGKHPDRRCDFTSPSGRNYFFEDNTWTEEKDHILRKHVMVQAIQISCRPLEQELAQTKDEDEIKKIKIRMQNVGKESDGSLLKELDPKEVNWCNVAKEGFDSQKTPMDCCQRWVSGTAWNQPWDKEEVVSLMRLGKEFRGRQWKHVADQIGTGRFVFDYFVKYQTTFNAPSNTEMKFRKNEELDRKLEEIVAKYPSKINWYDVGKQLKMSAKICQRRWNLRVNPQIKKGRWEFEEDERLREAVSLYGTNSWTTVSRVVPQRTSVQCRARWMTVLNPSLNKTKWTPEEEALLVGLCKPHTGKGIPWAQISKSFVNRTPANCKIKWKRLISSEEKSEYDKTVIKREMIKVSSTDIIDLKDFDEDMIPEDIQEEIVKYTSKKKKKKAVVPSDEEMDTTTMATTPSTSWSATTSSRQNATSSTRQRSTSRRRSAPIAGHVIFNPTPYITPAYVTPAIATPPPTTTPALLSSFPPRNVPHFSPTRVFPDPTPRPVSICGSTYVRRMRRSTRQSTVPTSGVPRAPAPPSVAAACIPMTPYFTPYYHPSPYMSSAMFPPWWMPPVRPSSSTVVCTTPASAPCITYISSASYARSSPSVSSTSLLANRESSPSVCVSSVSVLSSHESSPSVNVSSVSSTASPSVNVSSVSSTASPSVNVSSVSSTVVLASHISSPSISVFSMPSTAVLTIHESSPSVNVSSVPSTAVLASHISVSVSSVSSTAVLTSQTSSPSVNVSVPKSHVSSPSVSVSSVPSTAVLTSQISSLSVSVSSVSSTAVLTNQISSVSVSSASSTAVLTSQISSPSVSVSAVSSTAVLTNQISSPSVSVSAVSSTAVLTSQISSPSVSVSAVSSTAVLTRHESPPSVSVPSMPGASRSTPSACNKFNELISHIERHGSSQKCLIVQEPEVCNHRDAVLFSYEENPALASPRPKRKRTPTKTKEKSKKATSATKKTSPVKAAADTAPKATSTTKTTSSTKETASKKGATMPKRRKKRARRVKVRKKK